MNVRKRSGIVVHLALVVALAVCALALPAMAGAATAPAIPSSYIITGVPDYQQIQAVGCGAAALQMTLNYWGPFVDQKAVYDAARTSSGTALPDVARAGQFSALSFSAGNRFPSADGWGYPDRPLGYAGFYFASTSPWLDQLKAIVAQGYPVQCLTDWLPDAYGPHYRLIVGYDDAEGVVIIHDPWAREFKQDSDYQGSMNQNAAYDRQGDFVGWKWSYADFLAVWKLPTDGWGIAGHNYGAAVVAPWKVTITAPVTVAAQKPFKVQISATYPCPAPFGTGGFPTFPASDATLVLSLPAGVTAVGGATIPLGGMSAGQTKDVTVTLTASGPGAVSLGATASGTVSGSLGAWRDYPAYNYTDRIGGSGASAVTVTP